MAKDFYATLGIDRAASPEEIQKAYRRMAREYHPDLNPGDKSAKAKFQEVQQAYEVLNDPEKRKKYDRYGSDFEHMGSGSQGGPRFHDADLNDLFGGSVQGEGGARGFADIFRQFTQGGAGGASRRSSRRRGQNLTREITVPFHTAAMGGEVPLSFMLGGTRRTINVRIPAGMDHGQKIRLRGQGEPSPNGGSPGDLIVTVKATNHPYFRRNGLDLDVSVPITISEAAAGAKIDLPTPRGVISLTIPPGTDSGRRLRIRGMGIQAPDGRRGDLYGQIEIVLPSPLSSEDVELLKKIDAKSSRVARQDLRW